MINPNSKGRPAQVSKQAIIECALDLGLSKASMHAVGKALGVSATALYRHVKSKDELILECSDHIVKSVVIPEQTEWTSFLYEFARSFRKSLLAIPGSVEYVRYNHHFTPSSQKLTDHSLGVLLSAGFEVQQGFMAFSCVFTRVTDIVQHQEQSQRVSPPPKGSALADDNQYKNLALLLKEVKPVDYEAYFEEGVKVTIEGLKAVYCK